MDNIPQALRWQVLGKFELLFHFASFQQDFESLNFQKLAIVASFHSVVKKALIIPKMWHSSTS